jgi:hypothetical protein
MRMRDDTVNQLEGVDDGIGAVVRHIRPSTAFTKSLVAIDVALTRERRGT